ncbi:uncharacterized protein [Typha angustifolia]|uniref:uncharacterized protein n=1 Tax=Typha angustifolia TaxID=59011 RepID=UPI003C2C5C60
MAILVYHAFSFLALFSYGIYHLISATIAHLKTPSSTSGRLYYPLPFPSSRLRHLPLYLALFFLLLSVLFLSFSSIPTPLLSFQTAIPLFLFLLLALFLLFPSSALPHDVLFLLASLAFALIALSSSHSSAAFPSTDLQSKSDSISALISAASAAASLVLAVVPRLFLAEIVLASSIVLRGLWFLQTALSLYVEGFIPEGCHVLLEGFATRCEIDEPRARAKQILDLAFELHVAIVVVIVVVVYIIVTRLCGGGGGGAGAGITRRHNGGSYESLPRSSSGGALADLDHVQMKALAKSSAQA